MNARIVHESFLTFGGYRYLKLAAVLVAISVAAYALMPNPGEPHGGTWQGYGLGAIAGALLLFLLWFGIRRRRYATSMVPLRAWMSAHIYLGAALIPIVLLHSDGDFSLNFHTLFLVIVVATVLTGLFGLVLYVRNPPLIASNRGGMQLGTIISEIAAIDQDLRALSRELPDEVNRHIRAAEADTAITNERGGAMSTDGTAAATARQAIEAVDLTRYPPNFRRATRKALSLLARKETLVMRARSEVGLKTQLRVWLFLHVPLAVASVVGLAIHVFSVFFYW